MTYSSTHNMLHLPPIDARITPPPEELLVVPPGLEDCPIPTEYTLDTAKPDVTSLTGPSRRNRQRRRPSMYRPKINFQQQPLPITNLVFSLRPYGSLYAERAYLDTSLQIQSNQAASLMEQYSTVEAKFLCLTGGKERRRLRKQMDLLRLRINYTVEQENIISRRLGELYVEIQSRESWAQFAHQIVVSMASSVMSSPLTYTPMSPMSRGIPSPATPLNGGVAEFVPQSCFGDSHAPEQLTCHQDPAKFASHLETVDEAGEDYLCEADWSSKSLESDIDPATPAAPMSPVIIEDVDREEQDEFEHVSFEAFQKRRLSLPCLRTIWPEIWSSTA